MDCTKAENKSCLGSPMAFLQCDEFTYSAYSKSGSAALIEKNNHHLLSAGNDNNKDAPLSMHDGNGGGVNNRSIATDTADGGNDGRNDGNDGDSDRNDGDNGDSDGNDGDNGDSDGDSDDNDDENDSLPDDSSSPPSTTTTSSASSPNVPDPNTSSEESSQLISVNGSRSNKILGLGLGLGIGGIAAIGLAGLLVHNHRKKANGADEGVIDSNSPEMNVRTRWRPQSFMGVVASAVARLPRSPSTRSNTSRGMIKEGSSDSPSQTVRTETGFSGHDEQPTHDSRRISLFFVVLGQ
ncbi:hypothetical protein BDF14DRAFT_1741162 [Spinellus fusiger]|nr:hypothetical protein BDF14DRAFT_1741162 [Spinellus fusiger]